jgi:uncharacterized membrane protein YhaH (DUF805 family)
MASETFEQVLTAAQADGSFTPAWKKFVNTKFYVAIVRSPDSDPKNFNLHVQDAGGKPAVTISELRERLAPAPGNALVVMSGAEVVRRLHADAAILVALSDRAFSIARDRVDWLKKGIEASQARAAEKAKLAAGAAAPAVAQPAPVPASASASAPAPAAVAPAPVTLAKAPPPLSPVQRNQVGVLDVAALKPRNITLPKIGLEFFVPGDWTESPTAIGLRFSDSARAITVEASGFHRPNLSMAQWLDMRLTLVGHEMRYLTQDGEAYPFEGEGWRGRVKGMAAEFTGTFPGDTVESRYLVACIWTDGVLASITVRAPSEVFEQHRALFKWLLSRVDMNESAATIYSPPASLGGAGASDWDVGDGDGETPPIFGFSLAGRMGRARAMAYSFPLALVAALVGILAAVMIPSNKVLGGVFVVVAMAVVVWFCLRLMVLRMHDVNLSGKWLLGAIVTMGIAGATQNLLLLAVSSVVFWIGSLVIYLFIPGTKGDNEYGGQPGPNSTLVNVGAVLFVLLQLAAIGGAGKNGGSQMTMMRGAGAKAKITATAGKPFMLANGSFSVVLPGTPEEIEMPPAMLSQLGGVELHQYQLMAQDNLYMLQSIDYGDRMPDNRFDAMDAMQDSLLGKDGRLVESSPILLKGTTGRQVRIALPNGGVRAARFAVVGATFCMVSITARDGVGAAPAIDAFLQSFKLN